MSKISRTSLEKDTPDVAQYLLGKRLVYDGPAGRISGIINETEAYTQEDPACHTFGGRRTKRTDVMFRSAGHVYIYLIYGMHYCLNIVTEQEGRGCAVLIRSVIPEDGLATMRHCRGDHMPIDRLTNGPAKLVQAFAIPAELNGETLFENGAKLTIEDTSLRPANMKETPRIGIRKGTELLWRYQATRFK